MATFLDLYTQILDELERPDLVTQAKTAVQAAVQQYKHKPFWFTESFFTFYTVRSQEYYGAVDNAALASSPEIKKITGLFFNFRIPLTKREWDYIDDISSIPTSYAMPEDWAYAAQQVRLYPIPDKGTSQVAADGYPLTVFYTPLLTTLSNDSDSNAWTNEGYDLIRCRAKQLLLSGPMREQAMEGDMMTAKQEEQTFLSALYIENSSRKSTGHSWATQFQPMPIVPFGEWLPDLPPLANPGAETVQNAVAHDPTSYEPMLAFAEASNTISTQAHGAIFGKDALGNVMGFAGTQTRLYDYTSATAPNWKDVTRAAGSYNVPQDDYWSWVFYGTRLIATQSNDDIQQFVMGSSTLFTALAAGTAPKAHYVARVRDNFIMVANTVDPVSGTVPWRVWWPSAGDPMTWPTPGTSTAAQLQSDFRDLIGNGGEDQGIVGGLANADVAVFQRSAIWRGMYVGPPVIFSFAAVETARGCAAPASIVSAGPIAFYLADDGFYSFDGIQSTPIGRGKVDRTFWADVDLSNLFRVNGQVDRQAKVVYWAYPGPGNMNGNPNRQLAFNYAFNRWSLRVDGGSTEVLVQNALTLGYTMEQLDAFGTMDTLPEPLDSIVWQGGSLAFGAFDDSHKLGFYNGATLPAIIDTTEAQLNDGGTAYVSRVQPIIDTPNATMQLGTRMRQADPVTFGAAQPMTSRTGWCPVRGSGAYHRGRLLTVAGDAWTHAQGVLVDFRPAGRG